MQVNDKCEWTQSGLKTEAEYVLSQKEWDEMQARIEELEDFAKLVIEELDVAALTDCESGVASASARAASEYLTDFRHTREAIHKIKDRAAELLDGADDEG